MAYAPPTTTKSARVTSRWESEKKSMNCEMGSSGDTATSSSLSRTQPCVTWSRATFTHTESIVSVGTVCISATTTRCPFETYIVSNAMSPTLSASGSSRRTRKL